MNTYDVYFRSDLQWGMREFVAKTPAQALKLARRFAAKNPEDLNLDFYEACDAEINEIEVCDSEHNSVAVWFDEDLRLRLAAPNLLTAAEQVVARWEQGDLAEAVRDLSAAISEAKGDAA